nr:protein FLC EXPRESSOR-like isoform X1 [Ipomoea batatas]
MATCPLLASATVTCSAMARPRLLRRLLHQTTTGLDVWIVVDCFKPPLCKSRPLGRRCRRLERQNRRGTATTNLGGWDGISVQHCHIQTLILENQCFTVVLKWQLVVTQQDLQ